MTIEGMAGAYHSLEDFAKAEEMYRVALDGNEKSLGKDHKDTKWCAYGFAILLCWKLMSKEKTKELVKGYPHLLLEGVIRRDMSTAPLHLHKIEITHSPRLTKWFILLSPVHQPVSFDDSVVLESAPLGIEEAEAATRVDCVRKSNSLSTASKMPRDAPLLTCRERSGCRRECSSFLPRASVRSRSWCRRSNRPRSPRTSCGRRLGTSRHRCLFR